MILPDAKLIVLFYLLLRVVDHIGRVFWSGLNRGSELRMKERLKYALSFKSNHERFVIQWYEALLLIYLLLDSQLQER